MIDHEYWTSWLMLDPGDMVHAHCLTNLDIYGDKDAKSIKRDIRHGIVATP